MTEAELQTKLHGLISQWESECVEFKAASNDFDTDDLGKYFSALANEANLRSQSSAWLVFGVDNKSRKVTGTAYRLEPARLHSLKQQVSQSTQPSITFREIHEIQVEHRRVILLEIPPAPRGIPIAWKGHYYGRNGESLGALHLSKIDEIRQQSLAEDWSIGLCPEATLADLDSEALRVAREKFIEKHQERISEQEIRAWSEVDFLNHARLSVDGKLTRSTLLLLGRRTSTHHLAPAVAELTWKLEGEELAYEHFHPPFLLTTSLLYQRIRNLRLTLLPPGQLLPVELLKYDQRIVLEALHNCIAHQDYTQRERVLVIERPDRLIFQNAGSFAEGSPEDYVLRNRTPTRYRNRFLAEAMVHLRMIDTMGFGIREIMFKGQRRRYLPLPDFDLSDPSHVMLTLHGRFIDENFSRHLLQKTDLPLPHIFALDRVQKGLPIADEFVTDLRRRRLIEGRRPLLHVSEAVARITGTQQGYRAASSHQLGNYAVTILEALRQRGPLRRPEIDQLLLDQLPNHFSAVQKSHYIHNLLTRLRTDGRIHRLGGKGKAAKWSIELPPSV